MDGGAWLQARCDDHQARRAPYINELGIKGIGEVTICGVAPAIANAVYHATGRRVRDLPITLDQLRDTAAH